MRTVCFSLVSVTAERSNRSGAAYGFATTTTTARLTIVSLPRARRLRSNTFIPGSMPLRFVWNTPARRYGWGNHSRSC